MQHNGILTVGKTACAVVLSCLLATSPFLDGTVAARAYAANPGIDTPAPGTTEGVAPDATKPAPDDSKYTNEVVPLVPSAPADNAQPDATPAPETPATGDSGANAGAPATGDTPSPTTPNTSPNTTPTPAIDRVTTDVELSTPEGDVPAKAGTVIVDGVKYTVNPDGGTAKVTGWYGTAAPEGDVVLAEKVVSGADEYRVTSIADKAFENCDEIESLTLPDSLEAVGEDAFKGCAKLQRIDAGERNETFSTHDGILFTKNLATLLICPEGKQGVAQLPESTTAFEPTAFAACRNIAAFQVAETNATFATIDGILYTSDRTRLLLAPASTVAVTLAPETTTIAAGAFAECANLNTIVSNAAIQQIEPGAFALNTITSAVVALVASENYDALKAVWDDAGFSHYTEPATPGEIQKPEPQQSGFAFQLLDDYTLAVSWVGEADPEANLVIPTTAQLNGIEYKVSTIAAGGFQGRDSLSSVQIRAPITTIGDDAFAGCAGLASIELAEGISSIGAGAFSGTAIENATIPASVSIIGAAAFANCANLSRILTFSNAVDVAGDAIAGCTGVSIYAPYEESGAYPWNPGLVVSGNHILPYGVSFSAEPLSVEVGETADLFEGGICEVPEGCELSYAYAATPISVEAGQVTGKKAGTSEVNAVLSMDGVELDRSVRVVEVTSAPEEPLAISADVALLSDESGIMPLNAGGTPSIGGVNLDTSVYRSHYDNEEYGVRFWYCTSGSWDSYVESTDSPRTGALSIPSMFGYAGDPVYAMGVLDGGFQNYTQITSVSFIAVSDRWQPHCQKIGRYAFAGCTSLESITFPDTITNIYAHAFDGDTSLKSIDIPSKVTTIEDSTFLNCTSLTSVTIPEGVTTIGPNAFKGCKNLKSITLPSTLTSIAAGAFQDTGLTSVTIPASVASIDPTAFGSSTTTSTFSSFSVNASNATYKSVDGVLYNKAGNTLVAFPAAKGSSFVIPAAVTTIGPNAFKSSKLTSIILPATVSSVGASSFAGSASLKEVLCLRGANDALTVANCFTSSPTVYCDSKKASAFSGSGARSVKSFGATLSPASLSLVLGQTASSTLTASSDLLNSSAFKSSTSIAWSSSDTAVATVSPATGASTTVTGKKIGSATVTAQLKYGTQVLASSTCATSVSQTYTVHFNGNGAPGSMADQTFVYGTAQNLSPNTFNRDGYTFVGWATNSEGTGTLYTDKQSVNNLSSTPGGTVNLWAKWTPKQYQATFNTDGGSTVNSVTADFGATFAKPADPSKEGYTFAGWYKEDTLKNVWNFDSDTMPLDGVTLYAKWEANTFTVTFDTLGGGAVPSAQVKYNEKVAQPATNPERPGWTFAGWCIDTAGAFPYNFDSPVTKNFTLYASWKLMSVSDTFGTCAWEIDELGTLKIHAGTLGEFPLNPAAEQAPWYPYRSGIKAVQIDPGVKSGQSLIGMFYGLSQVSAINGLENLDTSAAVDMGWMFRNCASLTSLNLLAMNSSNVTSFANMFEGCANLVEIKGLANLDTGNARLMNSMFMGCANLASVDLSNFDTSNMTTMSNMFGNCQKLTSLDLSSFTTGKTAGMSHVFLNCENLTSVALPDNFVNSTASNTGMFSDCVKLQVIPENLTLPSANMSGLFTVSGIEGKLSTYYAGTDQNVRNYNWDADGRVLQNGDCTVTFKADNGQADVTTRGPLGGKAVRPSDPTKDGLTFAGWYKDEACTQIWRFATDAVAGDTTLYAKWVTYDIAYEYPADSGQYVYYDILTSGDGITPGTARTAEGISNVNSPNKDIKGTVVIPAIITKDGQEYTVVEIGSNSFGNVSNGRANKGITSITLPESIELIGGHSLRFIDSMVSCTIPYGVKTIGNGAFYGNKGLTTINLPGSVQLVDPAVFSACPNLRAITVSEDNPTFTSIDGVLFSKDATQLHTYPNGKNDASYAIPSTVVEVLPYAMNGAVFSTLDIPDSVETIGQNAFYMCPNLQSLVLPDRLEFSVSVSHDCPALNSVVLGSSVTSIPEIAFIRCTNLKSITAYGNVTSIAGEPASQSESAFYGVDKTKVTVNLPGGMIGGKSFDERKAVWVAAGFPEANVVQLAETTKVVVSFDTQGGSYIAPQTAEGGLTVSKPETPTLNGKAFAGWYSDAACTKGNEWDFATWVTENTTLYAKWVTVETFHANAENGQELKFEPLSVPVGDKHGTVKLVENEVKPTGNLVIPATVQDKNGLLYDVVEIGKKAISQTEIESLVVPNTVTLMRNCGVYQNYSLKSISLPASLKTIENQAITECTAVESLVVDPENPYFFSENNTVIYSSDMKILVLAAPMSLEGSFTIPSTVEEIQGRAFYTSPRLTSIHIPASVRTLGDSVFSCCPLLENIEVEPANLWLRSVDGVLYSRTMDTLVVVPGATTGSFTVPEGVVTIKDGAMTNCALTKIELPSTVATIQSWAMQNTAITSIVLPASLTTLGSGNLGSPNLKSVIVLGKIKSLAPPFIRPGGLSNASNPDDIDIYLPDSTADGVTFDTLATQWKNAKAVNVNRMTEDDAASGLTYTMQNDFSLSVRATSADAPAANVVLPATRTLSGGVNTYPVSVVEQNAFKESSQLKELTLPSSITTLGASAFEGSGLAGGKLHVFGDLSAEGINEGTEVTGSGSFKGLDKSKITVDFAASVSAESKALWAERKFATSAQTFVAATFDTRGGSAIAPQRLAANTKITQPDTPTKGDMMFVGWYSDPELTTAWDFNTPITSDTTLYAKWKYGEGKLPTVLNGQEGTDASWELTEDGTLTIKCDKLGAQIKSLWKLPENGDANGYPREKYWSPLRDKVKHVVMESGIKLIGEGDIPANMNYWFAGMTNLADMNGIYFPDGVEKTQHTFGWCSSVKEIPENLTFPESLTSMNGLYYKTSIAEIPASFKLPSKLEDAIGLFNETKIVTIPKEFEIPQSVKYTGWMFSNCTSLKYLPEGFTLANLPNLELARTMFYGCTSLQALPSSFRLPEGVIDIGSLFGKCTSLSSLPEGFTIPASVGHYELEGVTSNGMSYVFGNCPSLTTLPNSFDFPADLAKEAKNSFICDTDTPIRYAGENQSVLTFDWTSQKRTLVTPVDVTFDLRYGNLNGEEDPVIVKVLPGDRVAEPSFVPVKDGYVFTGWFTDGTYTTKWDFENDIISRNTLLYAGWALAVEDTFYSEVDGKELRFQILTKDGASGTGTVRVVRNDHGDYTQISGDLAIPETVEYEGNTYTIVEVGSEKDTGTSSVFQNCTKLTSVSIPATVKVLGGNVFCDCPNIKSITFAEGSQLETISMGALARTAIESIVFPETVKTIGTSAFLSCSKLTSVALNEGLEIIGHTAFQFTGIESIDIPRTVQEIDIQAFEACLALKTVSIPSSVQAIRKLAFNSCFSLTTIQAESAIAFLDPTAFADTTKQTARVLLPAQSPTGTPFETLAAAWGSLDYGFTNVVAAYGDLPTTDNANNGHWELSMDGTLRISVKQPGAVISNLWADQTTIAENYWGPVRAAVQSAVVEESVDAVDMNSWFEGMRDLTDLSGVRIPASVTSLDGTFAGTSIVEVPETVVLPENVTNMNRMFMSCSKLESLPENFLLPMNTTNLSLVNMFCSCFALKALPERFTLPDEMENCKQLLYDCSSLKYLPDGFRLPRTVHDESGFNNIIRGCRSLRSLPDGFTMDADESVKNLSGAFKDCASLTSLPAGFQLAPHALYTIGMFAGCRSLSVLSEGFTIPSSVGDFRAMFEDCTSLTSLPNNFSLPTNGVGFDMGGVFKVEGDTLPIYYGGSNPSVSQYVWGKDNRTLVTPDNRPDGTFAVTLNTKSEGEVGPGQTWTTVYTNMSGVLAEPAAPSRPGMVFALWYYDEDCTQRVDFTQPLEADTALYGKFVPGTRSGSLPTVEGSGSARWSLSDAGTLYIMGSGNVTGFGWSDTGQKTYTEHWGPYRSEVQSIVMDPSLSATDGLTCWFIEMKTLTDLTGFVFPLGATDFFRTFQRCTSLVSLPEGFELPGNTYRTACMFQECFGLKSLPDSFTLPEGLSRAEFMFAVCRSLESLPERFTLPQSTWNFASMFAGCPSLRALPDGFDMPGYKPDSANTKDVFKCALAEDGSLIPTYYHGSNPTMLNYDWESQNRTLISDAGDRGMFTVTYKTMDESGAWTTRTTSLTDSKGVATNPGAPLNGEYVFTGWCTDEACLNEFDFSFPLEQDQVFYGKWIQHGGRGTQEGKLPTVNDAGNAWWWLTLDGELGIECENDAVIADFNWVDKTAAISTPPTEGAWSPYRDSVTSVAMRPGVSAVSTGAWFMSMGKLTDISHAYIPAKTEYANCMFAYCSSLSDISSCLTFPAETTAARSIFTWCESLTSLPDGSTLKGTNLEDIHSFFANTGLTSIPNGFLLPDYVKNAKHMFATTKLTQLPDGFVLPTGAPLGIDWMFGRCYELESLPAGFTIPDNVIAAQETFNLDSKLKALPEGFSISSTETDIKGLFVGCTALTYIPSSLHINVFKDKTGFADFFRVRTTDSSDPVTTYYAGSASDVPEASYWLSKWNRTLVTADNPADTKLVDFMLPGDNGEYPATQWISQPISTDGKLKSINAPQYANKVFVGWFIDAECTTAFDFTKTVAEQIASEPYVLYAKYQENSGMLATVNDENDAKWELTPDGVLRIHAGSSAIVGFGEDERPWFAFRAEIQSVQMDADVTIEGLMEGWFVSCKKLLDATGVFVPEGVTSVARLFAYSNLEVVPEGFTLPEGVTNVSNMFEGSKIKTIPRSLVLPSTTENAYALFTGTPIERLPEGFSLPKNVKNATSMFYGCSSLVSVPDSFVVYPDVAIDYLFFGCSSLVSLPKGFTIPEPSAPMNFVTVFTNCSSLTSLPEGFDVPTKVSNVYRMFFGCTSLKYLPASLNISDLPSSCPGVNEMFKSGGATIDTYYAGTDVSNLLPSGATGTANNYWSSTYQRTLYTGDSKPANSFKVTFMLQKPGEAASSEWMTVLSDASGKVSDPLVAAPFGYAFMGWKDASGNKFNFDTDTVSQDTTLYGTFSLVVDVDVPLKMSFALNSSNQAQPQDAQLRSFTPVPLEVTSVTTQENAVADEVFPDAATRAKVGITFTPKEGTPLELGLNDSQTVSGLLVAAAKSASSPGVLDYTIGLRIPSDTLVKRYEYNRSTSIASITYQVAPKQ